MFFRKKTASTEDLLDPFKMFPKRDLRHLKKSFSHVPPVYVESIYDLFYLGSVGVIASFGTDKANEMLFEYSEFLSRCEEIAGRDDDTKSTKDTAAAINKKFWGKPEGRLN